MRKVCVVFDRNELLGEAIKVFMKDGGKFHFKVTGAGTDYISGFDDEGIDLLIKVEDIEFVVL